jgi:predicted nucleic acid-binding protein
MWQFAAASPVLRHIPEDDPILATALSAHVDYLVTGDQRLRDRVPSFQGIPLVSPAAFLDVLNRES